MEKTHTTPAVCELLDYVNSFELEQLFKGNYKNFKICSYCLKCDKYMGTAAEDLDSIICSQYNISTIKEVSDLFDSTNEWPFNSIVFRNAFYKNGCRFDFYTIICKECQSKPPPSVVNIEDGESDSDGFDEFYNTLLNKEG